MRFTDRLDRILTESVIDIKLKQMSSDVWDKVRKTGEPIDDYKLKEGLRQQILDKVEEAAQGSGVYQQEIEKIAIIGSICTHNYTGSADIDVHVFVRGGADEEKQEKFKEWRFEENFAGKHPLELYLEADAYDQEELASRSDCAYDVKQDVWLFWNETPEVNLADYYEDFKKSVENLDVEKEDLRRDLIDYKILKKAKHLADDAEWIEWELEDKIDEINTSIDDLILQWEELKDARTRALRMAGSDIDHGVFDKSNSTLPDNVVYKLLERYHYKEFIRALKQVKDEGEEVEQDDLGAVGKAFRKLSMDL